MSLKIEMLTNPLKILNLNVSLLYCKILLGSFYDFMECESCKIS